MRILGLSGSLRAGSYNSGLLTALSARSPKGVELILFDGLRDIPFYDPDIDGDRPPAAARALRAAIDEADAVLFSTPEYNATIPAVIKNAVDWASRPAGGGVIRNVPAAVIGAGPGQFGGVWAQDDLRKSLRIAGARVIEAGVAIPRIDRLVDDDGVLTSEVWLAKLDGAFAALVDAAGERLTAVA